MAVAFVAVAFVAVSFVSFVSFVAFMTVTFVAFVSFMSVTRVAVAFVSFMAFVALMAFVVAFMTLGMACFGMSGMAVALLLGFAGRFAIGRRRAEADDQAQAEQQQYCQQNRSLVSHDTPLGGSKNEACERRHQKDAGSRCFGKTLR